MPGFAVGALARVLARTAEPMPRPPPIVRAPRGARLARAGTLLGSLSLAAAVSIAAAEKVVAEPTGYRMERYDAPVPEGLAGARTVDAVAVRALAADGALVIDVVPEHRPPPELAEDELWLPPAHAGIPGALWLPDTGFGALDPVTERYLFDHLERATGGDRSHPIVFYCRMDCWMSWNAAKRALAAGYEAVHWFRDGIDDWRFEGYPTETLRAAPGERLPPAER